MVKVLNFINLFLYQLTKLYDFNLSQIMLQREVNIAFLMLKHSSIPGSNFTWS